MRTIELNARKSTDVRAESFDAVDSKGRRLGAHALISEVTFREATEKEIADHCWTHERAAGTYFAFRPCATRNGSAFGATKPEQLFSTSEERDAAVEKYLAGARKRAAKNIK